MTEFKQPGVRRDAVRVCVDARYLSRPGVGINQYLRDVLAELAASGADLTLLTDVPLPRDLSSTGRCVVLGGSGIRWEQWDLLRHLRQHSYDVFLAPANRGLPLLYRGSTALAVSVHDLIPMRLPRLYLWGRWRYAASYLLSQVGAIYKSDMIFAVSEATASDIARLFRKKAVVAPNAVPHHDEGPPGSPEIVGFPYFLYNGGLDARKCVDVLVRAFFLVSGKLPDHRLVLMGRGYESLANTVRDLGIDDRVVLTGYVPEVQKYAYLRGADALIYPSLLEGYGLPIVEGFAAGTPVITGTGGSLSEVGGDAVLRIDPRSPQSVAEAMIKVRDRATREQLVSSGVRQLARLRALDGPGTLVCNLVKLNSKKQS